LFIYNLFKKNLVVPRESLLIVDYRNQLYN
jgi:hypothetical protein